jgi:hypothetical protein
MKIILPNACIVKMKASVYGFFAIAVNCCEMSMTMPRMLP